MAMMECPRCGFVQPKDRYCANCGLDSENYQPKPEPVTQQLLKSPLLYVGGIVVLVIALALFFVRAPGPERNTTSNDFVSQDSLATVENSAQVADTAEPMASPPETQAPPQASSRLRAGGENASNTSAPTSLSATAALDESAVTQAEDPDINVETGDAASAAVSPTAAATVPTQIQIQFYEFPRAALSLAGAQSQVVSEGDQYRILLHSDPEALAEWLRRGRRLPGSRSTTIREGANLGINFAADSAVGNPLGRLVFDANVNRVTPVGLVVEVRGQYNAAGINPVRFTANPTMTFDSSLLVFGVITHLEESAEDFPPQPNSPLSILESADFQDKLSEFVTVIQLK